MNPVRCDCGHKLYLGDSCHDCRKAVPRDFYDYYLSICEGLNQFQMWHCPIPTPITLEVRTVLEGFRGAQSAFDILAVSAMCNHLMHYNGDMATDYFQLPYGFVDQLSNGFSSIWDDVDYDAQQIFESECLRPYIRRPWEEWLSSSE